MSVNQKIKQGGALAVLLLAACACLGCEPKVAVFETSAIDAVRTLVVVPMSSGDVSAGVVVSSIASTRLTADGLQNLTVVEPALWRLEAATQPALSDQEAAKIARSMGAQAVLTGTVEYVSQPDGDEMVKLPNADSEQKKSPEFLYNFARRSGQTSVTLRVLAAQDARPIYVHTATQKGESELRQIQETLDKALQPLEQYLKESRGKQKENKS